MSREQRIDNRAQSTEHRAQSTEHRAQRTEHRAQSTEHRAQTESIAAMSTHVYRDTNRKGGAGEGGDARQRSVEGAVEQHCKQKRGAGVLQTYAPVSELSNEHLSMRLYSKTFPTAPRSGSTSLPPPRMQL